MKNEINDGRRNLVRPDYTNKTSYWFIMAVFRIKKITMYQSNVDNKSPKLVICAMPDKEFMLSNELEKWKKGQFSHYEKLCNLIATDIMDKRGTSLVKLNDGYPNIWIHEKSKGIDCSGITPKHLVFGIIDMKPDGNNKFTIFVGVKHEKKAKIDGIWVDEKYSGRIMIRNDVMKYPSLIFNAKGTAKHPDVLDKENDSNNHTSWSLQIPNIENILFLGDPPFKKYQWPDDDG